MVISLLFVKCVDAEDLKEISLNEFISSVIQKNLNIKSYSLNKDISSLDIEKFLSYFDSGLTISVGKDFKKDFTGSILASQNTDYLISHTTNLDVSIAKKFVTGAELSLSFLNSKNKETYDYSNLSAPYNTEVLLNFKQPILKGFGIEINKSDINKAQNTLSKTDSAVEDFINTEILNAVYQYFDLLYSYKYLELQEELLQLAKNTHKINEKNFSVGLMPKSALTESKSEVAKREELVIEAKQTLLNNIDKLKTFIDDINSNYLLKPITETFDITEPEPLDNSVDKALKNRAEIKKLNIDIQNAEIDINVAKNNLLPSLTLNAYTGVTGRGDNYDDSIDNLISNDYHNTGIYLELKYPFGNREAKSTSKRSEVILNQLKLNMKDLKNQITSEVKKSNRNLVFLIKKINAYKLSVDAAYEKLKIEDKKYRNGLSDPFKVFSYQVDYITEKVNYLKANVDYSKEVINFKKVVGDRLFNQ